MMTPCEHVAKKWLGMKEMWLLHQEITWSRMAQLQPPRQQQQAGVVPQGETGTFLVSFHCK